MTLADIVREWVSAELGDGLTPSAEGCAAEYGIQHTPELERAISDETDRQTACETCHGAGETYDRGRFCACHDCAA